MKRMHWFLLAALAAPAAAAPAALTPNEITSADRRATRLSVNLGDEELQTLAQFGELRDLTFTGPYDSSWWSYVTLVTDAGLASLVKLHPKLRRLNLGEARHITDKGFAYLARLTQLEELTVNHAQLTDQGIAHLSRLRLSKLTLRFSGVTDAAMPVLAKMSTLEHLDLFGARRVTDTGVTQLAALRNLKTLNVGLTQGVTDRTITELAKLPLISLDLSSHGCIKSPHSMKVTDEGLQTLASMPTLRRIVLNGCPAVTREGVRALRAAAPQREVLYRRD